MIFEAEARIERPAGEVWRHLTDPDLMTAWMTSIDDLKTADGGPLREGSRLVFSARGAERDSDVVEFEAERRIALRSTQGPITATYRYEMRPADGGATVVTLRADCVAKGLATLITPLLRPLIRRTDGNQMADLKRAVEAAQTV